MSTEIKYYKEGCEVCVPITLKIPIVVEPGVMAKRPVCAKENGSKTCKPESVAELASIEG